MKVSVVIPAYNQSGYLREALASALHQTHRDIEVIVVDDGSKDDTRAVCESFQDSRVRYVYQVNDGTSGIGARNVGMMLATGEWIALLDQDDRWAAEKIEKQLQLAAQDPSVGAVFCRVRYIDGSGVFFGEQKEVLPEGDVFHSLVQRNRYHVATGMFRRNLLGRSGLPDESCGFGDWALWVGVTRHTRVAASPEHWVDYREHGESYLGKMAGEGELRKLADHLKTLNRNGLRVHVGCRECKQAMTRGRVETAKWILRSARRTLRAGGTQDVITALLMAWRAAPGWLGRPWITAVEFIRLALSALVGFVRWSLGDLVNLRSK